MDLIKALVILLVFSPGVFAETQVEIPKKDYRFIVSDIDRFAFNIEDEIERQETIVAAVVGGIKNNRKPDRRLDQTMNLKLLKRLK